MRKLFEQALADNQPISFIYDGGSEPGSIRDIQVHSLDDKFVVGKCLKTNVRKKYLIEKSKPASSDHGGLAYTSGGWSFKDIIDRVVIPDNLHAEFKDNELIIVGKKPDGKRFSAEQISVRPLKITKEDCDNFNSQYGESTPKPFDGWVMSARGSFGTRRYTDLPNLLTKILEEIDKASIRVQMDEEKKAKKALEKIAKKQG